MSFKSIAFLATTVTILCATLVTAQPMEFRLAGNGGNCNGCEWLAAQGEIVPETPDKLRQYVRANGTVYHIVLNSPGGDLIAGIELGKVIRELGTATSVGATVQMKGDGLEPFETTEPGICASACAFAFMGGTERLVGENDLLGVHQFYSTENTEIDASIVQMLAGMSLLHSIEMGVDPRVIVAANGTPPDEMYWFNRADLADLGLDTSAQSTEPWKLEPYRDGLVLTTRHHENSRRSVAITLFCRSEDRVMRLLITEQFHKYESYTDGKPLLNFGGTFPLRPILRLGGLEFQVSERNVEFERFSNGDLLVSLFLPHEVETAGGSQIELDPDLARVFGSLLRISVTLPGNEWLRATMESCV